MGMSHEMQRRYDRALRRVVYKHGTIVDPYGGIDWTDSKATDHLRLCNGYSQQDVREDFWDEFVSLGGPGDNRTHVLALDGVNCPCGQLTDRRLRWEASIYEVAAAVFEEAFQ